MSETTTTITRAGAREWIGLGALALPTLLLSLDITVLHLGVPRLSAALAPSAAELLWIIDIYGFMIAGFLVTMGALGDRIGRRRLLLLGAAAFGVASAVAAFSTTPTTLIAARAIMGIAGATLMPSTLALISSMFRDAQQRAFAIGIWATMFSAGIALGPIVGGALLEHFWWGSVFLLGIPVMLLLLIAGPLVLPEHRDRGAGRPDLPSVALIVPAMLAVVFGIKETAAHGVALPAAAALLLGLLLATLFVRRQRRLADPLLDLGLFTVPAVRAGLIALLVGTLAIGGIYLFLTQYLQLVAGHSPLVAGLMLLPGAAALVLTSLLAPALARRYSPVSIVAAALTTSALGFAILAVAAMTGTADATLALLGFAVAYAGIGPVTALGTDLVVGSAPAERAGSAAALSETSTEIGVGLGVALLGSLGVALYRAGIPDGAASGDGEVHARAKETLAAALQAAKELAGADADALRAAALDAFTTGFAAAAVVGALLLLLAAGITVATMRRPRAH